jgi:hypothetical protein
MNESHPMSRRDQWVAFRERREPIAIHRCALPLLAPCSTWWRFCFTPAGLLCTSHAGVARAHALHISVRRNGDCFFRARSRIVDQTAVVPSAPFIETRGSQVAGTTAHHASAEPPTATSRSASARSSAANPVPPRARASYICSISASTTSDDPATSPSTAATMVSSLRCAARDRNDPCVLTGPARLEGGLHGRRPTRRARSPRQRVHRRRSQAQPPPSTRVRLGGRFVWVLMTPVVGARGQ